MRGKSGVRNNFTLLWCLLEKINIYYTVKKTISLMKRFAKTKFFTLATKSLSGCSLTGLDKSYNAFVKAVTKVNQPSAGVYYNALCYVRVELVSLKNQLTESLKKWRVIHR
ncbi:hypothetical protein FACS189434_09890 [Bacteroidia bacterium]|nr:hypothetical protein FACS189434_09890 [Bacteroidia bacterium]